MSEAQSSRPHFTLHRHSSAAGVCHSQHLHQSLHDNKQSSAVASLSAMLVIIAQTSANQAMSRAHHLSQQLLHRAYFLRNIHPFCTNLPCQHLLIHHTVHRVCTQLMHSDSRRVTHPLHPLLLVQLHLCVVRHCRCSSLSHSAHNEVLRSRAQLNACSLSQGCHLVRIRCKPRPRMCRRQVCKARL